MAPPQSALRIVLLTPGSSSESVSLSSEGADAVVILASDQPFSVAGLPAALPVIALADRDEQGERELFAAGADEVVRVTATADDIVRAIHRAVARRRGRPSAAARPLLVDNAPQLESLARLAGGIAHEFNNLMTVVQANVEQLHGEVPEHGTLRDATSRIENAAQRAAVLTRQLLAFGRQQTLLPAPVDLNVLVADLVPSLQKAMGSKVAVTMHPAPSPVRVQVDPAQITEVITNLAATGLEAMPAGGRFTIATSMCNVGEVEQRERPWLPRGRFARLQISDTGHGIEEQALPHLFEPFAPARSNTPGLAMSSVYGAVKQSGGFIWAESRPDQGTRVTILLPPLEQGDDARSPARPSDARGSARVLLVEDTDEVRETFIGILRANHFNVIAAASAEEALEIVERASFDILVTDIGLPGRNGAELARELRQRYPGVPVLFVSGYAANALDPRDLEAPASVLQKPFSGKLLVARIHELLGVAAARR